MYIPGAFRGGKEKAYLEDVFDTIQNFLNVGNVEKDTINLI